MFSAVLRTLVVATLTTSGSCFVRPIPATRCFHNINNNNNNNNNDDVVIPNHATGVSHVRTTAVSRQQMPIRHPHGSALQMKVDLGPEETVEKYGLEAGLFKALKSGGEKDGENGSSPGATAQDLLKRYGSAYLITSITFAAISFGICYVAVSNGVDMAGLLSKVGIQAGASAETTGTVAVAYAIHKAASPIRFPPTVALTPVVAKFLGKDAEAEDDAEQRST